MARTRLGTGTAETRVESSVTDPEIAELRDRVRRLEVQVEALNVTAEPTFKKLERWLDRKGGRPYPDVRFDGPPETAPETMYR